MTLSYPMGFFTRIINYLSWLSTNHVQEVIYPKFELDGECVPITGVIYTDRGGIRCKVDGCESYANIGLEFMNPIICEDHGYDETIYQMLQSILDGIQNEYTTVCSYINILTKNETIRLYFTKSIFIMLPFACNGIRKQEVNVIVMDKSIDLGYTYLCNELYKTCNRVQYVFTEREVSGGSPYCIDDTRSSLKYVIDVDKCMKDASHIFICDQMYTKLKRIASHNDIDKYKEVHHSIMGDMMIKDIPNRLSSQDSLVDFYSEVISKDIYREFKRDLIQLGYFEESLVKCRGYEIYGGKYSLIYS